MDIDTAVPPANYRAALQTPEADKWLAAKEKPRHRKAAYYANQAKS